ncbi:MAG: DUF3393 domain-containing protein [Gammaproteobacteria bacterium]|nr:DUF3393 domain-containing protein [Gammaproteobacteria bacterium]
MNPHTPNLTRRSLLKGGLLALTGTALSGCTVSQIRQSISTSHQLYQGNVSQAVSAHIPGLGIPEIDGLFRQQVAHLLDELAASWGEKRIATPKEYVKYTDHYQSRALINFTTGRIQIETLRQSKTRTALKQAIVSTLLTPEDPAQVDLFTDQAIQMGKTPFLFDVVRDQDNKAIRYAWRANRFADYLLKKGIKQRQDNRKTRYYVVFEMVKNYQGQQQRRYQLPVLRQAKRFHISASLIYSIIETESAFNPYAVSHAPAYGLMQIVPTTAGRDAYQLLNKRRGTPTKQTLFSAAKNIEYGTAYLSILFNRYLSGIHNHQAQTYCVTAAYNTGAGNVLKSFHPDRNQAIKTINRLTAQQVYTHLTRKLSSAEARNYVVKVTRNRRKYQT